jgi:phage repressor protein C with HTH and peptisase S24 domain
MPHINENKPMAKKAKNDISLLGKVILERLEELGKTQSWLAIQCGVSANAVSKWIRLGQISTERAGKVSVALDLSLDRLLAFAKKDEIIANEEVSGVAFDPGPSVFLRGKTPVVGSAQLGDGGYWAELEYPAGYGDGYVKFTSSDENAYALRCRGESMRPRIKDGEFVIVEPSHPCHNGDEVLIQSKDGRVMVKELLYIRDGTVYLGSVNESHGKISLKQEEIVTMHFVSCIAKSSMWVTE